MDTLRAGQRLNIGEKITSSDGNYFLLMQGDGNLVLFDNNGRDYWATNVVGKYATLQGDGNFVVFNQEDRPVWATNIAGNIDPYLVLQNDRNLVIYQNGNTAIWASNTAKDTLRNGQRLNIGEKIVSSNGKYFLLMQGDGNLVLFDNNGSFYWATNVVGKYATMQGDGNFVVYDQNNHPVWASNTDGHPNSLLLLQNDRNLVIYQNDSPIWSSNTSVPPFAKLEIRTGFTDPARPDLTPKYLYVSGHDFYPNGEVRVDCGINFGVGNNKFISPTGNANAEGEILINVPVTSNDLATYARINARVTDLTKNVFVDVQKER